MREDRAVRLGLDALELTFSQLIPHLGEPVAVQRAVEYTLASELEWSVLCYLDLETVQQTSAGQERVVIDYKVKTTLLHAAQGRPRLPAVRLPVRTLARGQPGRRVSVRADRQAGPAAQGDRRFAHHHEQIGGTASRRARADRAGRPRDRRLLRAVRPRGAMGVRRPGRLEMQRALLRRLGNLPGRSRPVSQRTTASRCRSGSGIGRLRLSTYQDTLSEGGRTCGISRPQRCRAT